MAHEASGSHAFIHTSTSSRSTKVEKDMVPVNCFQWDMTFKWTLFVIESLGQKHWPSFQVEPVPEGLAQVMVDGHD